MEPIIRREILRVFGEVVYGMSKYSPGIDFRLPEVGEEVFVQHGFFRNGAGVVKSVCPDSPDEKVVIAIIGKDGLPLDVFYTYGGEKPSHWECVKGKHKIDSGASIALYTGGVQGEKIDPNRFLFIYPPTEFAREYWSRPRRTA